MAKIDLYKVVKVKLDFRWKNKEESGFFTENINGNFIEFIDLKGRRFEKLIDSISCLEEEILEEEKEELMDELIGYYQAKSKAKKKYDRARIEYWDQNRVIDAKIKLIKEELQKEE